jgi:enterochelin esterase-like enzyme
VSLAINHLLHKRRVTKRDVDVFLEKRTCPIVEGTHVTFVFRADVSEVNVRHFIFGLPSASPMTRLAGTDLWYHVLELPARSRVEYKFEVIREARAEWVADPRNPFLAHDPFGANSVCHGAGYEAPDWIDPNPESRKGETHELFFDNTPFGDRRRVTVYLPARFRTTRRYPLLIVHDGGDYLRYTRLQTALDNLIHGLEVQPLIVALTHPGNRMIEYPDHRPHQDFLVNHLVPEMERRYPVYGTPDQRCLMGASFGAVASLSTAWRYPGVFGRLLLQSGSFAFTDIGNHKRGPAFDPVVKFMNAFRESPGKPADRAFMSCGTYESLIYENRSMAPFFREIGMHVRFTEARDGHNWENWRDRMREALSWLFPGPLWMVYE